MTMNEESNAIAAYRVRIGSDCLARHAEGFFEYLRQLGYSPRTASEKCDLLARLGRWLDNLGSMEASFDEATLDLFHRSLNRAGHRRRGEIATGRMLLQYLRGLGCVPIPPPPRAEPDAIDQIVRDYGRFLSSERGLAPATLVNYLPVVRGLLTGRFEQGVVNLGELQPADIHRFVLRYAQARSRRTAQLAVSALRSFLRYLRQRGDVATDLASAAPAVACWSLSGLPKFLPADQVKQVVGSCDRGTLVGKRDYTILLLLARLGLRAGEVVILTLDDLDWSNGDIIVRGKGQRLARLPLPPDVGEALVEYLRDVRPPGRTRRLFLRIRAPLRGLAGSASIDCIVARALKRAGLAPPLKGAHLLRHSLATDLLRRGASLAEIGQLLRHSQPNTTQIYAKVDIEALRRIAVEWPAGAP
jgi:site-specific recombinase XerD